jgi:TonB-dependent starch-binding outer membrane protein SusC
MSKKLTLIMMALWLSAQVLGQARAIEGKVIDESGEGLPGVNIVVKGQPGGTITDFDGLYRIEARETDTLSFSFIGFRTQEFVVGNRSRLDVEMGNDAQVMEEVVVIGYGAVRKQDLTGSVSVADVKELQRFPVSNVASAMQGRLAGVQVVNAAEPGRNPQLLVRGYGTIYGDPNPLVVIDGIQTGTAALGAINPADIESMQVLKDASAAAIYGSRAANGVIIITTKSGTKERMQISFNAEAGVQMASNRFELMNTEEYAEYTRQLYVNSSSPFAPVPAPAWTNNPEALATDTDWQDVVFRNALMQNYNLGIQGGGQYGSFYMGLGYLRQEGVIVNSDFERYNFRINSDFKYGRLRVGEAINFSYSHKPETDLVRGPERLYYAAPQIPINDPENLNGLGAPLPEITGGNNAANPLAYDYRSYVANTFGLLGSLFAELDLAPGLSWRSELNLTLNNRQFERYYEPIAQSQAAITSSSYEIDVRNSTFTSINSENYLRYNRSFGGHSINAIAGFTAIRTNLVGVIGTGLNVEPGTRVPQTGTSTNGSGQNEQTALLSQLARVNYNYMGKYLFTASLRRDGASNFSEANRWGYFPSFSMGWRLSEERFMPDIAALSSLKIRGGYGELGRNLGTFLNTLNSEVRYPWSSGNISGVAPVSIPNENLRWEVVKQINLGLDLELFQGRATLTGDYFIRLSEDMIIQVPLPQYTGLPAPSWANIGSMSNRGFELDLNYNINPRGVLTHKVGLNLTMIQNRVESLRAGQDTLLANNTITTPGHPVASHYGWVLDRINPETGQPIFADLDRNGRVDGADRMILGSPHPDGFFGINYNASYKNFDLAVFFQGVWGNQIMNASRQALQSTHLDRNRLASVLDDAFDPVSNPNGTLPIISLRNQNDNDRAADRWIEDGDYIRLRNIQLGYSFSPDQLGKFNISSLRLYANAINPFILTNYSGLDPDITPGNSVFLLGRDSFNYPPIRSFNVGIQMGL